MSFTKRSSPHPVPDDNVGVKSLLLQAFAQPGDSEAVHRPALQIVDVGLQRERHRGRQVFEHADALDLAVAALGDEQDGMSGIPQVLHEMKVLSGRGLVDE